MYRLSGLLYAADDLVFCSEQWNIFLRNVEEGLKSMQIRTS